MSTFEQQPPVWTTPFQKTPFNSNETDTDTHPPTQGENGTQGNLIDEWLQSLGFSKVAKGGLLVTLWGSVFAGGFTFVLGLAGSLWGSLTDMLYTHVEIRDSSRQVFTWLTHKVSQLEEMKDWKTTRFEVSEVWNLDSVHNRTGRPAVGDLAWLPQVNKSYRTTFEKRSIYVRILEQTNSHGNGYPQTCTKKICISCMWSDRALLERFILHAKKEYEDKMKEKTIICTSQGGRGFRNTAWSGNQSRPSRPISTVILPGNASQRLIRDMEDFMAGEAWYYARGIPYRRGYLLYGPPGTGKTSFVTAAAGHLRVTICILNLSSTNLSDDCLTQLLSSAPKHSIILLEDIDAALDPAVIGKRSRPSPDPVDIMGGGGSGGGITLSGLLNAIDGVAAQEGKMLFMSTNHLEKLDPALVRPGRMDVQQYFGYAGRDEVAKLFRRFYGADDTPPDDTSNQQRQKEEFQENLDQLAEQFAQKVPEHKYTLAEVQGHLMSARLCPEEALRTVGDLLERRRCVGAAELADEKSREQPVKEDDVQHE
jgi:hypothetical protein